MCVHTGAPQMRSETPWLNNIKKFGNSLIIPGVASTIWIILMAIHWETGIALGVVVVVGGFLLITRSKSFPTLLDLLVGLAWWVCLGISNFGHISVTRTTVLITTVVWGIIFAETSYRFVKEKIDIILPRGPIG